MFVTLRQTLLPLNGTKRLIGSEGCSYLGWVNADYKNHKNVELKARKVVGNWVRALGTGLRSAPPRRAMTETPEPSGLTADRKVTSSYCTIQWLNLL